MGYDFGDGLVEEVEPADAFFTGTCEGNVAGLLDVSFEDLFEDIVAEEEGVCSEKVEAFEKLGLEWVCSRGREG